MEQIYTNECRIVTANPIGPQKPKIARFDETLQKFKKFSVTNCESQYDKHYGTVDFTNPNHR